jgi:uncharacterized protein (UPF0264 family)
VQGTGTILYRRIPGNRVSQTLSSSPGLLVSVRSAAEARAALDGGADLIDVKEPLRGSLGAADRLVIEEVIAAVGSRVPVSAALGEWRDGPFGSLPPGVTYAKCGFAQLSVPVSTVLGLWRETAVGGQPVLVAYADYQRAGSPDPIRMAVAACHLRFPAFLIDTVGKDGSGLGDWMEMTTLMRIRTQLDRAGVRLALAGSLDAARIHALRTVRPDWFAVRGAACEGGRNGTVCSARVRQLKSLLSENQTGSCAG